jgi:uncharacterized repeat protein (TIGR01451 family)
MKKTHCIKQTSDRKEKLFLTVMNAVKMYLQNAIFVNSPRKIAFVGIFWVLLTLFMSSPDVEATLASYYLIKDNNTTVASGITTDYGNCNNPSMGFITLANKDTSGSCNGNLDPGTSAATVFTAYYDVAYAADTTVTGQASGNVFHFKEVNDNNAQFSLELLYVIADGTETSLGSQSYLLKNQELDADFDLSAISGTVPAGAKLGFRLSLTSCQQSNCKATVFWGPSNNTAGNGDSAYITVDESIPYLPDAMIKLSSEGDASYLTDDTYESTASVQAKSQGVVSGSTATYTIKFENDGSNTDSLIITGTGNGSGFTVQYLDDTATDRTADVTGPGYTISSLSAGANKVWTLNVTPSGDPSPVAGGTAYEVFVTATSSGDGTRTDQVKATTSSTSANITLLKSADKATADPGEDITYTVDATNGSGLSGASSIVVTDPIPANTGFKVNSETFDPQTSTLTRTVDYRNSSGWGYTPTDGGCSAPAGYDYCVLEIKWTMTGTMPTNTSFRIGFVVRIQ